jgi:hypothetical protein
MSDFKLKVIVSPGNVLEGGTVTLKAILTDGKNDIPVNLNEVNTNIKYEFVIQKKHGDVIEKKTDQGPECDFITSGWIAGIYQAKCILSGLGNSEITNVETAIREFLDLKSKAPVILVSTSGSATDTVDFSVVAGHVQAAVTMRRTEAYPTDDQALWVAIRNRTIASDFKRYDHFLKLLFPKLDSNFQLSENLNRSSVLSAINPSFQDPINFSIQGPYAYDVLKLATQVFLTLQCGVVIKDRTIFDQSLEQIRLNDPTATFENINQRLKQYLRLDNPVVLPYLDRIVDAMLRLDSSANEEVLPFYHGILKHRMTAPSMLELIWSYWEEEGMLMQTMNAVAFRFQNMRSSAQDPLGELEIDPLRPLNNLIWGFIQDEHNRLTVPRRAYEYDHHYGLKMLGKAVPSMMSADSRSKFIEAFHNLLYRTAVFYKEDAETTVIADAFPLLNALREVHLLLAEGAHNQFGDLPWTARAEMLMSQWLLARPEMREFLRGRHMVPYQEPWMGAIDCMKKLQGWTDTSVTHFHELAVTGERIVLSIRYGDWSDINNIEDMAKNWARYWKADIQRYIHGYMTVTGVDLMAEVTDTREASQRSLQPSALLKNRLTAQQKGQGRIPVMTRAAGAIASEVRGYVEAPAIGRSRLLRYKADE